MNKAQKFMLLLWGLSVLWLALATNWNEPVQHLFIWGLLTCLLLGMVWVFADKKKEGS